VPITGKCIIFNTFAQTSDDTMNNTRLRRSSLPEEMAGTLQTQLSEGKWLPKERLPTEPELMKMFGVSRSTVREAIRILSHSGWVRVQQGQGTFVESVLPDTTPFSNHLKNAAEEHLDEVRMLLERKVVEKACINRSDKDLESMAWYLAERKKFSETGNVRECIDMDIAFHTSIAKASGNPILADLYYAFAVRLKEHFIQFFITSEDFSISQVLHEELLESIRVQNTSEAIRLIDLIAHQ
jgi:DNA-binding FadR family transcriptional regulator